MKQETKTTIKDLINRFDKKGYRIIKKKKERISNELVIQLAEEATGIEPGESKRKGRQGQYTFSRYLIVTYLYNYLPPLIVSSVVGLDPTMISYAMKQRLFAPDELRFMKPWQQYAVELFMNKIELAGGECKYTERTTNEKK